MRTFEKTWHAKYQNIDILVHNFWNFERTGCWININGRRVYHNEKRWNLLLQVYYWVNIWNLKEMVQRLLWKSAVHSIFWVRLVGFQ